MCHFLPVHHLEWHFWPGQEVKTQHFLSLSCCQFLFIYVSICLRLCAHWTHTSAHTLQEFLLGYNRSICHFDEVFATEVVFETFPRSSFLTPYLMESAYIIPNSVRFSCSEGSPWNLSDSKSPQVIQCSSQYSNRSLKCCSLICVRPLVSKSSSLFTNLFGIIPSAPTPTGITVTFMFDGFS